MEIPASLAAGTGGRPLGTERSPATLPHASGELFAREVAQAHERNRGTGTEERRLDELDGERRATRRAGFERERPNASDARPAEATYRPEHAPVVAQPAVKAPEPASAEPLASAEPEAPSLATSAGTPSTAPTASAEAGPALSNAPLAPGAPAVPGPRGVATEPAALPSANTASSEPVELAQILRAGSSKDAKPAVLPSTLAAQGPAAAVLERAAEILRQIELHASADVKRLTLELEPAELGRLSIQLALRARRVTAIVRAENASTLEALRAREGELCDVLSRRGITADAVRFELGFGSRSRGHERARAAADEGALAHSAAPPAAPHIPSATPPRARAAWLDTYA